ncbi:MAG: FtsH protease activity modulator HflK [Phycisphaerae bacterium]|nr:MAG: FtsH protease activity modulator HflK [Planctomycetota bacterium]KAB2946544.1 MAG: FtsH protease activity modulator HflK [Phycisphaerae bacterium]MBE7455419.1 FtsH protease activity modulator HflK [Planctomycetia bacterium]MCK6464982.1 FtsH protease activity modulator HflK [Phycisphaerae bacterium]MCL4717595.1 FtsH protease activity modulator HflK [Phycisphaerae bacterium]
MTSGSAARRKVRWGRWAFVALVLGVIGWLGTGFYSVEPGQRGIVLRFGRVVQDDVAPGLHYAFPPPIGEVHRPMTTEVRRVEVGYAMLGKLFSEARRSDMLTGDENILKIKMAVQYRVRDPSAYLFRAEAADFLVERAVDAALGALAASMPVDDILTTRKSEIQQRALSDGQALLDAYDAGLTLIDANLHEVNPPAPVIDAFTDVGSAQKDAEQRVEQARTWAARTVSTAQSEAARQIDDARGLASARISRAQGDADRFVRLLPEYHRSPELTRTRLLIETFERVMSRARVVILPPAGGDDPQRITIYETP